MTASACSSREAEVQNAGEREEAPLLPWRLASLVLIGVLYGVDQFTKWVVVRSMVEGESIAVFGEWLRWTFYRNPGAAFSIGEDFTWVFTLLLAAVGVYAAVLLSRTRSVGWILALSGLLAGVLGNLTDRLLREPGFGLGHVVDFIHVRGFAIFNIADSCICVSIGALVLLILRGVPVIGTVPDSAQQEA